jgi:hypothetical protein
MSPYGHLVNRVAERRRSARPEQPQQPYPGQQNRRSCTFADTVGTAFGLVEGGGGPDVKEWIGEHLDGRSRSAYVGRAAGSSAAGEWTSRSPTTSSSVPRTSRRTTGWSPSPTPSGPSLPDQPS